MEVLLNFVFGYKWEWKDQKPNAPPSHSRYSTCVQLTRGCPASVNVPVETTKKCHKLWREELQKRNLSISWLSKFKLCDVFRGIVLFLFSYIMRPTSVLHVSNKACILFVACEQALRGALVAGREKEGEFATTSLEFEFHLQFPYGSPPTELSDFRQSARSGNELECKQTWKTRAKGNDVITDIISANQYFASFFDAGIQISET